MLQLATNQILHLDRNKTNVFGQSKFFSIIEIGGQGVGGGARGGGGSPLKVREEVASHSAQLEMCSLEHDRKVMHNKIPSLNGISSYVLPFHFFTQKMFKETICPLAFFRHNLNCSTGLAWLKPCFNPFTHRVKPCVMQNVVSSGSLDRLQEE